MIRILIVAGVRLYREGLGRLIADREGFDVVGTLADLPDTPGTLAHLTPDVVLLDMATSGAEAIPRRLAVFCSAVRVVAIGVADADVDVIACAEAGAAGFVTRDGSFDELISTIERAARGELALTPRLAGTLARRLAALAATREPGAARVRLSRREREIAALLGQDLSNKEIAVRLGIEVATVKNHVHNLLEKLHVHRRSDAARATGLTSPTNAV
jgi:two-component system, NarL family, nitrate/nitrite response regulator NarL